MDPQPTESPSQPNGVFIKKIDVIANVVHHYSRLDPERLRPASVYFVGREAEIAAIDGHLSHLERAPVCLIHGMGGSGKTELALKAAEALRSRFQRQLLIEIANEPNDAAGDIAILKRAIGSLITVGMPLPDDAGTLRQQYLGLLANENVLVVADNIQYRNQLDILRPPVGCALLATSRNNMQNAQGDSGSVPLGLLTPDQAVRLARDIHQPLGAQAERLAKICGYLPLALLISAKVLRESPDLSIEEYLDRLQRHKQRLRHLRLQPEDATPAGGDPRSSVEASINLSYELLSPEQKQALQQISVIVAGFTKAMGQAVLRVEGQEHAGEALLESIARRSLLAWDGERKRYFMHDLVREFGLQMLDPQVGDQCSERYVEQAIATASAAEYDLFQRGQQLQGLQAFDLERSHIDAAWAWLLERADRPDHAHRLISLAGAMADIHTLRPGARDELVARHRAWLQATRLLGDRAAETQALINLGQIYCLHSDYPAALETLQLAREFARQQRNPGAESRALQFMSVANLAIDNYERAIELEQESTSKLIIALRTEAGDLSNDPRQLTEEMTDLLRQTKDTNAFDQLVLMRQFYRASQNQVGELAVLFQAGAIISLFGLYENAIEMYEEALALADSLGNRYAEAQICTQRGAIHNLMGNHQAALGDLERAVGIADELGSRLIQALARIYLGQYYMLRDLQAEARGWLEQGLELSQSVKSRGSETVALLFLGGVELSANNHDRALENLLRAERLAREIDHQLLLADIYRVLAASYCVIGDSSNAFDFCYRSIDIARVLQHAHAVGLGLWMLGLIYQQIGNVEAALLVLQLARKIATDMENAALGLLVFKELADIYLKQEQYELACQYLDPLLEYSVFTGNENEQMAALRTMVFVYRLQKQYNLALERYQRLLSVARRTQSAKEQFIALERLGDLYMLNEQHADALDCYHQHRLLAEHMGDQRLRSASLGLLATGYARVNDLFEAIHYYHQQIDILYELDDTATLGATISALGDLYAQAMAYQSAWNHYQQHFDMAYLNDDTQGQALALCKQAGVQYALEDYELALALYSESLELTRTGVNPDQEARCLSGLGSASFELGDYQSAIELHRQAGALYAERQPLLAMQAQYNEGLAHTALGDHGQALALIEPYANHLRLLEQADPIIDAKVAELRELLSGPSELIVPETAPAASPESNAHSEKEETMHLFKHGYALLVGVGEHILDHYSLTVTVEDVKAVRAILVDPERCAYPPAQVRMLCNADATAAAVRAGLNWLKQCAAADPEATIVFYYSGHGQRNEEVEEYFLMPHDAVDERSALSSREISASFQAIQARRLLIILDCCHAEGVVKSSSEQDIWTKSAPGEQTLRLLAQGEGRAIIASSRGKQQSFVRRDKALSIFTFHLLEALQGAGNLAGTSVVTIGNLMSHLGVTVEESAQRQHRQRQTPCFKITAEEFPVALVRGGKGFGRGGWREVAEEVRAAILQNAAAPEAQDRPDSSGGSFTNPGIKQFNQSGGINFVDAQIDTIGTIVGTGAAPEPAQAHPALALTIACEKVWRRDSEQRVIIRIPQANPQAAYRMELHGPGIDLTQHFRGETVVFRVQAQHPGPLWLDALLYQGAEQLGAAAATVEVRD